MTTIAPSGIQITGGVGTHKDTRTAAAVDSAGREPGWRQFPATLEMEREVLKGCKALWPSTDLEAVAMAVNNRPRRILGWRTPAEDCEEQLRSPHQSGAATAN